MKNKILISWYAPQQDFKSSTKQDGAQIRLLDIEENGPTISLHANHWADDYEKHILLYNTITTHGKPPEIEYADSLRSFLQKRFREHKVEIQGIDIEDVINLEEIASKIQPIIAGLTLDQPIDIFISPGTPAMQMAWIINGLNFKEKATLFQTRAGRFTKDGKSEKLIINLNSSIFPRQLNVAQAISTRESTNKQNNEIPDGLKEVYALAEKVAQTDRVTCLLLGPNGSGKERLARYLHNQSSRRDKPYRAINCAAFSDELLRSELFGHRKGSFTGAEKDRKGILAEADSGTVFLDEIGDISPVMQVSLLRVLQEQEILPIGENLATKINVRVIAATNRNLKDDCASGKFRWDLYFRLHVAPIEIAPLIAQGRQVIRDWINRKIVQYAPEFGDAPLNIHSMALEKLLDYPWPGNIRELEHLILRLYTFRDGNEQQIGLQDLPSEILDVRAHDQSLAHIESVHIEKVLRKTNRNISRSATILGITRNTLKNKMEKYGLVNDE